METTLVSINIMPRCESHARVLPRVSRGGAKGRRAAAVAAASTALRN